MSLEGDKKYADVPGVDDVVSDTVVPDGETWEVQGFSGHAAYVDETTVCLIWDPDGADEIIACTHGDAVIELEDQVLGNGVKVLRIALINDTADPRIMGGSWEGRKVS